MEHHTISATECHLPYGITQCYLLPDKSEHTTPSPQPVRPVLNLPTPEGWMAELTLVTGYIPRWFTLPQMSPIQVLLSINFVTITPRRQSPNGCLSLKAVALVIRKEQCDVAVVFMVVI